jgi:amino acid permease
MSVPKFGLFINLVGSVACTALAFVVPVLIYNRAFALEISRRRIWAHRALMLIGCVCGGMSFYVSIYNIVVAVGEANSQLNNLS